MSLPTNGSTLRRVTPTTVVLLDGWTVWKGYFCIIWSKYIMNKFFLGPKAGLINLITKAKFRISLFVIIMSQHKYRISSHLKPDWICTYALIDATLLVYTVPKYTFSQWCSNRTTSVQNRKSDIDRHGRETDETFLLEGMIPNACSKMF